MARNPKIAELVEGEAEMVEAVETQPFHVIAPRGGSKAFATSSTGFTQFHLALPDDQDQGQAMFTWVEPMVGAKYHQVNIIECGGYVPFMDRF